MSGKELVGKALWPAAMIGVALLAGNAVQKFSQDAVTVSQNALKASENAVTVSNKAVEVAGLAKGAVDTAAQTAKDAPQIAGDAAHASGEGLTRGLANGAVQVGAAVTLAPVTLPLQAAAGLLSEADRKNVEQVVNPLKWKLF